MCERKRSLRIPCVATAALLVCVYAWWFFFPEPRETQGVPMRVVFPTPLGNVVDDAVLVTVLVAFALGFVALLRRERIGWLPLLASVALLPVAFLTSDPFDFIAWSDEAAVRVRGGAEYHLLGRGWLEGTWAIARPSGVGPLQRRYEVLVMGTMADFDGGINVVRPASAPRGDGLFVAPSGIVVSVDSSGLASVAYDPRTDLRYGLSSSYDSDGKLRPIASLSPFLLLGPSAIPDPSDVAKLRKPSDEGVKATEADLNGPNPAVRRLARRLLGDAAVEGRG